MDDRRHGVIAIGTIWLFPLSRLLLAQLAAVMEREAASLRLSSR